MMKFHENRVDIWSCWVDCNWLNCPLAHFRRMWPPWVPFGSLFLKIYFCMCTFHWSVFIKIQGRFGETHMDLIHKHADLPWWSLTWHIRPAQLGFEFISRLLAWRCVSYSWRSWIASWIVIKRSRDTLSPRSIIQDHCLHTSVFSCLIS